MGAGPAGGGGASGGASPTGAAGATADELASGCGAGGWMCFSARDCRQLSRNRLPLLSAAEAHTPHGVEEEEEEEEAEAEAMVPLALAKGQERTQPLSEQLLTVEVEPLKASVPPVHAPGRQERAAPSVRWAMPAPPAERGWKEPTAAVRERIVPQLAAAERLMDSCLWAMLVGNKSRTLLHLACNGAGQALSLTSSMESRGILYLLAPAAARFHPVELISTHCQSTASLPGKSWW
nr:uncharacterized protein LOC116806949 [Taeniopygia guttata]XP_032600655.1 uncharacterized protein LOC116806949 [Taeniopygia guttata]